MTGLFYQFVYGTGAVVLAATSFVILRSLYTAFKLYFWARYIDGKPLQSYGKWAVVTGGSDGIGRALAKELARNGLNICLIARNEEKIRKVSLEIKGECKIETKIILADLSDTSTYKLIKSKIDEIDDVGILVNCAGVSLGQKLFSEAEPEDCLNMINTNVSAVVWMTQTVVAKMMANQRGMILNVGSIISSLVVPRAALYSASKAFMSHLSESLEHELKPYNIRVKCLATGLVRTNMNSSDPSIQRYAEENAWAFLSPEDFAQSTILSLRISHSPRELIGNFYHWLFYQANRPLILGASNRPARIDAAQSMVNRFKELCFAQKT